MEKNIFAMKNSLAVTKAMKFLKEKSLWLHNSFLMQNEELNSERLKV